MGERILFYCHTTTLFDGIFCLSVSYPQPHASWKFQNGKKGRKKKVETTLKNINLGSCCCPRCQREQLQFLPLSTACAHKWETSVKGKGEDYSYKWIASLGWTCPCSCQMWFPVPALVNVTLALYLYKPVFWIDGGYFIFLTLNHRAVSYLGQVS